MLQQDLLSLSGDSSSVQSFSQSATSTSPAQRFVEAGSPSQILAQETKIKPPSSALKMFFDWFKSNEYKELFISLDSQISLDSIDCIIAPFLLAVDSLAFVEDEQVRNSEIQETRLLFKANMLPLSGITYHKLSAFAMHQRAMMLGKSIITARTLTPDFNSAPDSPPSPPPVQSMNDLSQVDFDFKPEIDSNSHSVPCAETGRHWFFNNRFCNSIFSCSCRVPPMLPAIVTPVIGVASSAVAYFAGSMPAALAKAQQAIDTFMATVGPNGMPILKFFDYIRTTSFPVPPAWMTFYNQALVNYTSLSTTLSAAKSAITAFLAQAGIIIGSVTAGLALIGIAKALHAQGEKGSDYNILLNMLSAYFENKIQDLEKANAIHHSLAESYSSLDQSKVFAAQTMQEVVSRKYSHFNFSQFGAESEL
jgi:hypothetical protein